MLWIWLGFLAFILAMLALDLGVFHRHAHVVSMREAFSWSAVWVALSLAFSVFVYFGYENHWNGLGITPDPVDGDVNDGMEAVLKYLTGYVIEKSLSIDNVLSMLSDNVFVIAMIFASFRVPSMHQHRVLFWGILGALALRGLMIGVGAALIERFHWILYVFGGLLIFTGLRMLLIRSKHDVPGEPVIVRWTRRLFPVADRVHGEHFLIPAKEVSPESKLKPDGTPRPAPRFQTPFALTPLALALIMVEATDVLFAVDSIPAIFAITGDPFLVFTSNVFAILGLRSLYFALAGMLDRFHGLKTALALILVLVGVKMLSASWLKSVLGKNFNLYLLGAVVLILGAGMGLSWWKSRGHTDEPKPGDREVPAA